MAGTFSEYFWQYSILVFLSSMGMLQVAAAHAGLRGLLLFEKRLSCYVFAVLAMTAGFIWFYATGDRATEPVILLDTGDTMFFGETQCFATFMAGSFGALVFTLLLSSIIRAGISDRDPSVPRRGLDALKQMTFFHAITRSIGRRR